MQYKKRVISPEKVDEPHIWFCAKRGVEKTDILYVYRDRFYWFFLGYGGLYSSIETTARESVHC
jgi:hypothetical protein